MNFSKLAILSSSLLVVSACNPSTVTEGTDSQPKEEINETMTSTTEKPQAKELEARKASFNQKADESVKKIYKEGLTAVENTGILENALNVGDKAPHFTLTNAVGEEISLENELKKGPVVLVWYRGGWCPYCNINLHYLQEELPNFNAQGANLLALSPELPDQSINTAEKNELDFQVLSDVGNEVAREYGVVFKLTDEVAQRYNESFGLNNHNGDESNELPLAATYIINTDGTISYAFLDVDYRNRAEPSEITEFLKSMKKN